MMKYAYVDAALAKASPGVPVRLSETDNGDTDGYAILGRDGSQIYISDVSLSLWEEDGGEALHADDTGFWLTVHTSKCPSGKILAYIGDAERAQECSDAICAAIKGA